MTAILWAIGLAGFYLIMCRESFVPKSERFTGATRTGT